MAFVPKTDEELQALQGQGVVVPGTEGGGAGGVGVGGATGAAPAGLPSPNQSGTSGFTDVASFLSKNRESAQSMAQQVGEKLGAEAADIRGGIDTERGAFESGVNAGRVTPNAGLVDRAAADPTGFVKNSGDLSAFQKMRDAQYTGPTAIEESPGFGAAAGKVKAGQEKAKSIDTEAGRGQYLYGIEKNPTRGMVALDQLLIGADPGAREILNNSVKPFADLQGYLDTARTGANSLAGQAKTETEAARKSVADKFIAPGGAVPSYQSDFEARLAAAEEERAKGNAQVNAVRGALDAGDPSSLSQEQYDKLGLGIADWNSIRNRFPVMGLDPKEFYSGKTVDVPIDPGQFASADDYARESALEQLMGYDIPTLSAGNEGMAGTYSGPDFGSYDRSKIPTFGTPSPLPPPVMPPAGQEPANTGPMGGLLPPVINPMPAPTDSGIDPLTGLRRPMLRPV